MPTKTAEKAPAKPRGKRKTAADKRVDAKVEELASLIQNLDGLNLALAKDMLAEYVWMVEQMEALKREVGRSGVVLVTERGGENNRHEVLEESKYFIAYQRLVPKVIATASAIKKFCKDNAQEAVETDEFAEF